MGFAKQASPIRAPASLSEYLILSGAHNPERATPVLFKFVLKDELKARGTHTPTRGLTNGVFSDQFIFSVYPF